VYKLVEVNGMPRIKLSQDGSKITMPGKKNAFRLYGGDGKLIEINLVVFFSILFNLYF
jgi:nicotinic acid phosphoribosyltransferase